jgi:hypothetical protein
VIEIGESKKQETALETRGRFMRKKGEPVDFSTGSFLCCSRKIEISWLFAQNDFATRERSHGFGIRMVLIIALPLTA